LRKTLRAHGKNLLIVSLDPLLTMRAPEGSALFDAEHIERVEAELDSFTEKRARQAKDAERVEELWAKSAARDRARRREENRALWIEFHSRLSRSHGRISAEHEAKAQILLEESEEKEAEMNPQENGHGAGEGGEVGIAKGGGDTT
jgi:hypothetical protein